jgi:CDP-diacylglycerol--glycerol-3-phosphate 3-phosphatidyltransferase
MRLNLPLQLTLSRFVMSGLLVLSISLEWAYAFTAALGIFLLASLTDWLDGYLARKWNQITDLGKLLDPLADKVIISAAFIGLIEYKLAPMWMVVLIISREFLITGLRLVAAQKGMVLAAEKVGKHKTELQITVIIVALLSKSLEEFGLHWAMLQLALPVLYWLALVATVGSGGIYFYQNRKLFQEA